VNNRPAKQADNYGNLANIDWLRGRMALAEENDHKAVALFEESGRYYKARKTRELLKDLHGRRQTERYVRWECHP
jgi:hypothetical protein